MKSRTLDKNKFVCRVTIDCDGETVSENNFPVRFLPFIRWLVKLLNLSINVGSHRKEN